MVSPGRAGRSAGIIGNTYAFRHTVMRRGGGNFSIMKALNGVMPIGRA